MAEFQMVMLSRRVHMRGHSYKNGHVNFEVALLICVGFFIGGLFGAKLAIGISNVMLERIFGVAMLLISLKMLLAK